MRLTAIDWRALTDLASLKQRLAQAPTLAWVAAALVPPLVAGGLLLAARQADSLARAREQASHSELATLRAKAAATPAADTTPFAARLPLTQSSARAVTHLREAAESQSVVVASISTSQQAPTASTLGRMSLDVNLRGGYTAIKTVLAELLTRDSQQAVLQQVTLRRAVGAVAGSAGGFPPMGTMNAGRPMGQSQAASGDLEARIVATWFSRPLADPMSSAPSTRVPQVPASAASASASASAATPSAASAKRKE